ncbi:winged helix-turn-helix domain-containing protein [Hazenella sp. IB182357]|uniref:Winged helix-turn-helix domain-containing protein n=1 Tax=Polycladospora coralii TaxID=2771432 RepID=A0A926N6F5_9BACL|nr:winged helix-turn-helix domain-containing protein [Polycladospora coralii]MBD1372844.1 winged helix-turn-helix domain-containing protein [Polycladospora coralii]MBS7529467.1 winged helix-turn-helix domain-containing protein [Polycladospora coralii]
MNHLQYENIKIGDQTYLDTVRELLIHDRFSISFSRLEFRILFRLAQQLGQAVTAEDLIQYAWGTLHVSNGILYVYINRIRKKIETQPHKPQFLLAQRSIGYVLHPINT